MATAWNQNQVAKPTATFYNLLRMDKSQSKNWAKLDATIKIAQNDLVKAEKAVADDLGGLASLEEQENAARTIMHDIANQTNVSAVLKNEAIMESSFRRMLASDRARGGQLVVYRMAQGLMDKEKAGKEKFISRIILHLGDIVRCIHDVSFAELGPGQLNRKSVVPGIVNHVSQHGVGYLATGATQLAKVGARFAGIAMPVLGMGQWLLDYATDKGLETAALATFAYLGLDKHDEIYKQEDVGTLRFSITPLQLLETMMYGVFASSLAYVAFDAGLKTKNVRENYTPGQIRELHYKKVQEAYEARITPAMQEFVEAQPFQIVQAKQGGGSAIVLYAEDKYDEVSYLGHLIDQPFRRIAEKKTKTMIIAFRGTSDLSTAATNLTIKGTHYQPGTNREEYLFGTNKDKTYASLKVKDWIDPVSPFPEKEFGGTIHMGFAKYFETMRPHLTPLIENFISGGGDRVFFTGHSLGGACAMVANWYYCMHGYTSRNPLKGGSNCRAVCVTFAAPRVGDMIFAKQYEKFAGVTVRIETSADPVPRVPTWCPPLGYAVVFRDEHAMNWTGSLTDHYLSNYAPCIEKLFERTKLELRAMGVDHALAKLDALKESRQNRNMGNQKNLRNQRNQKNQMNQMNVGNIETGVKRNYHLRNRRQGINNKNSNSNNNRMSQPAKRQRLNANAYRSNTNDTWENRGRNSNSNRASVFEFELGK
jgi:hypothetical protein